MKRAAFALLIVACSAPPATQSPDDAGAEVGALRSAVDALRAEVDALKVQVAMLMAGTTAKAPHLIAYAGTPREVDLGPFVDWEHAYSEKLGAYYLLQPQSVYFESENCTGASWLDGTQRGLTATALGTLARPAVVVVGRDVASLSVKQAVVDPDELKCFNRPATLQGAREYVDTGVSFPYVGRLANCTAELR